MNEPVNYIDMMSRLFRVVLRYIEEHPEIIQDLQDAECFLSDFKVSHEERRALILDWFVFDAVSKTLSENLLEHLLRTDLFTAGEKDIYGRLRQGVYSIFSVKSVRMGRGMIVRDLIHDKEYEITDTMFARNAVKGDCVIMRVLPFQDIFILSGRGYVFPRDMAPVVELFVKENSRLFHDHLTPLTLWRLFCEQEKHERLPPDERLVLIGMECGMDRGYVTDVIERIKAQSRVKGSHFEIMEEFFHKLNPSRHFSFEELAETFTDLWNGFIAEKDPLAVKGSLECLLLHISMEYVQAMVRLEDYPDIKSAEIEAQKLSDRWFVTPREELGGRTPVDLILEERKALGNPQEEIGFSVQFSQLEPGRDIAKKAEDIFDEGIRMLSERKPRKALAAYQEYCRLNPDNHVVWHNMAVAHFNMGHVKKARSCLERAVSIKPDYKMALDKLKILDEGER